MRCNDRLTEVPRGCTPKHTRKNSDTHTLSLAHTNTQSITHTHTHTIAYTCVLTQTSSRLTLWLVTQRVDPSQLLATRSFLRATSACAHEPTGREKRGGRE